MECEKQSKELQNIQDQTAIRQNYVNLESPLPKVYDLPVISDDNSIADKDYVLPDNISTSNNSDNNHHPSASILTETVPSCSTDLVNLSRETIVDDNKIKPKKRIRNECRWQRNVRRQIVNSGKAYKTKSGREVHSKEIKQSCDPKKCRWKCSQKIEHNERLTIFNNFYEMACKVKQGNFIYKCMKPTTPRKYRRQGKDVRSLNFAYYLYSNKTPVRVCKKFFTSTLCISNNVINTVARKTTSTGILKERNQGKHGKQYKLPKEIIDGIIAHIKSFPRIESHYCRQDTKREYIEGNLNIATMHRLYIEKCTKENLPFAKYSAYEKIFNTKFNIAFYRPKKDQCSLCTRFKNSNEAEKKSLKEKYENHLAEKLKSREEKADDIAKSKANNQIVACYDLEAVIPLPCGEVSDFYYKSKINVINFTIFDMSNREGFCYPWHEGIAKRGANEIGSCVYFFLESIEAKTDVIFYSDNCVGQQKNKFVATMYLYAVEHLPIRSITHKFLGTGHTENEADNMHSLIEREKKRALRNGSIFLPSEVVMLLKLAKKTGKPFNVREIKTEDIIDWKELCGKKYKNFNVNESGEKVDWNNIMILRFEKDSPNVISYKTSYSSKEYNFINTTKGMRGRKSLGSQSLKRAYDKPPKISLAKLQGLLYLCNVNLIPLDSQNFYRQLEAPTITGAATEDEDVD